MKTKQDKSLKILFLYPNLSMSALVPYAVAILSAVLKKDGFTNIDLFDATFYKSPEETKDARGVRLGQVKPFNFKERKVTLQGACVDGRTAKLSLLIATLNSTLMGGNSKPLFSHQ